MNITRLNTLNDDKVIIKKEGGNSGGGGNTGGESISTLKYFNGSMWEDGLKELMMLFSYLFKTTDGIIGTAATLDMMQVGWRDKCYGYAVAPDAKIYAPEGAMTIRDIIANEYRIDIDNLPRITEEEFYSV